MTGQRRTAHVDVVCLKGGGGVGEEGRTGCREGGSLGRDFGADGGR